MSIIDELKTRWSWRNFGIGAGILLAFVALSLAYFAPAVVEGKDIFQPDVAGASGTAQDVRDYYEETGETSYWTNSLFGGMPMYQIAPSYPSLGILKGVQDVLTLQAPMNLLPSYSWLLFAMLVGFYIFMRSLEVRRLMAIFGAVMWAFSSYFIILIVAGHIWKLTVLAFIPPTIAGIIYTYRGKYLLGGVTTAFFAALQLMSNHIQMSYYFAFVIASLVIAYIIEGIRAKAWRHLALATGTTALAAILSIGMNLSNIYHTYEYTQETMRGGSAMSEGHEAGKASGLDKEYITAWSYGRAETLTLLIPDVYGGATGYLGADTQAMETIPSEMRGMLSQMNRYWGDQPYTAGPVYVGAFVMMLFVLGIFIVRTPIKWALVSMTILSIGLSWGHHMMWLSDLFIDYFPLYNKFRTVSSILVIAEFTIPTLAILALVEFMHAPREVIQHRLALGVSLGLTLGLSLLIAIMPQSFFSLLSTQEQDSFRQYLGDPQAQMVIAALKGARASIVSADAWRSVLVIVLSLGVCAFFTYGTLRRSYAIGLLIVITLVDLWQVDKRYLGERDFIDASVIAQRATPVSPVDKQISQDKDPHYRVLNASVSTFNDATTSYMHRSVGGYHAAKLTRYQDLIEHQISKGNRSVLNMLDTRYVITTTPHGELVSQRNDEAMGAAWFVDYSHIHRASTPQQEMEALGALDLRSEAVVGEDFSLQGKAVAVADSAVMPRITLDEYTPNRVKYSVTTDRPGLVVMSEVYYPHGWTMTINGAPADILRANYVLRAAEVSPGNSTIELSFDPASIHTTEAIAWTAQLILLLGLLTLGYTTLRRNPKNVNNRLL